MDDKLRRVIDAGLLACVWRLPDDPAAAAVTAYAAACASQAAVSAAAAASLRKGSAAALAAVPSLYAPSPGCLLLAGAALLCLAANLVLGKLKPLFFKYEFSHADNN